jgi:antirestriction protein ArdC
MHLVFKRVSLDLIHLADSSNFREQSKYIIIDNYVIAAISRVQHTSALRAYLGILKTDNLCLKQAAITHSNYRAFSTGFDIAEAVTLKIIAFFFNRWL